MDCTGENTITESRAYDRVIVDNDRQISDECPCSGLAVVSSPTEETPGDSHNTIY